MKNTSNNMNRKSILALAGTLSLAIASSANGQSAGNDTGSFIGGYSSAAQKIQTVSGTVQTGNRMNQAGQQAFPEFGEPLGTDSCGSETLTQSTNETFIDSNSVWCGTLDHNAETSLARGFIAPADLTLKCVTFGIRENTGGEADVNVRVLVGSPSSLYADLTLVSETVVSIADNTAFALFTAELGEVQIPAGSQFIVELNTPSRVPGLGGDGGLLSFGTNTLGQSNTTYMRGPECAMDDFADVASLGFGNRHLVMSLGYDNGIVPTIQGGFPMAVIGDAVMSQLGDDIVIAGDPNGGAYGVAIDYGTASSGIGATVGLIAGDDVAGATLSMNFVGEEQVASIQFSDYLGDPTVAVLDVDFADSELDLFDLYVYNDGELVGILKDQSTGSIRIRGIDRSVPYWIEYICGIPVQVADTCIVRPNETQCVRTTMVIGPTPYCGDDWLFFDSLGGWIGDEIRVFPLGTPDGDYSAGSVEINVEGVSGVTVDVAGNSPIVAIGEALSAPYYNEFGDLLTAQVGVSFALNGTDSDTILAGEDVNGDGLADLVLSSASGSISVDMMLGQIENASVGFLMECNCGPDGFDPIPCISLCPVFNVYIDGLPSGTVEICGYFDPWALDIADPNPLVGNLPNFDSIGNGNYTLDLYNGQNLVFSQSGMNGFAGGTTELPIRLGTINNGNTLGYSTIYPASTTFTTPDGQEFLINEARILADEFEGSALLDSMTIMAIGTGELTLFDPITVLPRENACTTDLNGDGDLNFFDISAFLIAYSSQDPAADFTNDGLFNFFDVSAFLSAFAVGCP